MFKRSLLRLQAVTKETTTALKQAPNRSTPWSDSQASRSQVLNHAKFLQKNLSEQPAPPSAMELIHQQPVRFVNDRIAVCAGNKQRGQGHPKVYINLEPKRAHSCGYCGLKYAMEGYKGEI
jgi:NADH dehydrogenase (ubiquinone) Fe-S protein 6